MYILSRADKSIYDGTARVDKNTLITLVTNGKDNKTVLFQDSILLSQRPTNPACDERF